MNEIMIELVKILPSTLWLVFIAILTYLFYKPICEKLLPNLQSIEAKGIKISLVRTSIDNAIQLAEKSPKWKVKISDEDKQQVESRAKTNFAVFENTYVLCWTK